MDSTGVSHILEHTALCGSQMYPVRDPFFKMLNRSLSTFMNAFTGTCMGYQWFHCYSLSRKTVNTGENFWNVYCFATNQMRDETAKDNVQTTAGISHDLI